MSGPDQGYIAINQPGHGSGAFRVIEPNRSVGVAARNKDLDSSAALMVAMRLCQTPSV